MFTLPDLAYTYDALGKYISKNIMELHHSKHHQTYVDNLNKAIEKAPELKNKSITELISNLKSVPEEVRTVVRNHGGGHYNHSLFWQFMSPNGGQPSGDINKALIEKYQNFEGFTNTFSAKALGVFGSGWAWLMPDLSIISTPNQDSPVMDGQPEPILGLDVWEHAYYLDYTYKRADYINAWWNVVNWPEVEKRYQASKS